MTGTALDIRPSCPQHGPMSPKAPGSPESAFCGVWYACTGLRCWRAHLLPSSGLLAQLDQQRGGQLAFDVQPNQI